MVMTPCRWCTSWSAVDRCRMQTCKNEGQPQPGSFAAEQASVSDTLPDDVRRHSSCHK